MLEAAKILSEKHGTARLVAGATTLYDLAQNEGLDDVKTLIDVSRLGLDYIIESDNGLKIGAATTFSEIAGYELSPKRGLDALFETAAKITPPQVRNMATMGGALCCGIPFLDMPTTVLALGDEIEACSVRGTRKIHPKNHFLDYFQTSIEADEILTSVRFPYSMGKAGSSFVKLGRVSIDFAVVNVASLIVLDESGECKEARVALGAVATTPIRWETLEKKLVGTRLNHDVIVNLMKEHRIDFEPSPSLHAPDEYKKLVIPKLVRDSLLGSVGRSSAG